VKPLLLIYVSFLPLQKKNTICSQFMAIFFYRAGSNVKGFLAWSFLDCNEWFAGFPVRFGLNFVDYNDGLKKYPKLSAQWYKNFLKRN